MAVPVCTTDVPPVSMRVHSWEISVDLVTQGLWYLKMRWRSPTLYIEWHFQFRAEWKCKMWVPITANKSQNLFQRPKSRKQSSGHGCMEQNHGNVGYKKKAFLSCWWWASAVLHVNITPPWSSLLSHCTTSNKNSLCPFYSQRRRNRNVGRGVAQEVKKRNDCVPHL